jgi:V/A-type H+-transporting ATPase subunit I
MAIAKIKKVEIIGLKENRDEVLALLQNLGIIELINIQDIDADKSLPTITGDINLLEIEEAISFLATFKKQSGFLQGMVGLKPFVYQRELKEVIQNFDWQGLFKELADLRQHIKNLLQHKEKLLQKRKLLEPWRRLNLAIDEIQATKSCGILLGVLASRDYTKLLENAAKENINFFSEIISEDKTNTYITILYLHRDFSCLENLLKNYHFNFIALGHQKGTVKDNLLEINSETLILEDQILEVKERMTKLAKEQFNLMLLYDYLSTVRQRNSAEKNLAKQRFTFNLNAWIRSKDAKILERELNRNFKEVVVFISEPGADEAVPVVLENRRFIQPFEFITQIYGMPKYNELDPTPFLAPFFFLYFGFCVSDVGYGALLIVLSWLALKKFRMGPQGKKFFKLFLFCGISTVIVGALTGSWFGNLLDLLGEANKIFLPLKNFKDSLVLLDPLKEPTKLLGIALSLGIIQVWFGNIVAAIGNIKNKRYLDTLQDQVPMLTLLFGLTGLGLIFLKLSGDTHVNLFKYAAVLGGIGLIATQGRSEKGIGARLFYGIYNLYNALSGYLSDVLSYSRLWALGLVTGVMASTINLIAAQFSQILPSIVPFIGKISFVKITISTLVLIVVFIFGHTVSFFMNLLGAFVHPVRLQFVEFFSKFFKSGGRTFKPFRIETKYISIVKGG